MDNDFILVLGMLIAILGVPSLISAFSSSRPPRMALILFVIGGGMISWAITQQPGSYTFDNLPDVVTGVIAKIIR